MPSQSPEDAQKTVLEAEILVESLLKELSGKDWPVVLVALQMLIPFVCLQMGTSFMECMDSLARNIPVFYKRWVETLEREKASRIFVGNNGKDN